MSIIIFGCKPEINDQIIADKYVNDYYSAKFSFSNNNDAKSDTLLIPLIDSIIEQTKANRISDKVRQTIVDEIEKIPEPWVKSEQDRLNNLKIYASKFQKGHTTFLEDLHIIDLFLSEKYWQHWSCDLGITPNKLLLRFDTIMLSANTAYELPIKTEYENLLLISNSIQGSSPNFIKFRTENASNKYQTLKFVWEAINSITGESTKYNEKIVIQLIKND